MYMYPFTLVLLNRSFGMSYVTAKAPRFEGS
jgi:hypothetical protein